MYYTGGMSPGSTSIISLSPTSGGHNPSRSRQIGDMSLSTPTYTWLNARAWESSPSLEKSGDFGFFYKLRSFADPLLCAPPPFCTRIKNRIDPHLAGRWILKAKTALDPGRSVKSVAWAEAHQFGGEFSVVHIVFGFPDPPPDESPLVEALAMLASACMVTVDASVVCLLPASPNAEQLITATRDFTPTAVWVPALLRNESNMAGKASAGRSVRIGKLDSSTWWESTLGATAATQVTYLKRRHEFLRKEEGKKKAPPRRRFSLLKLFGIGPKKRNN